MNSLIILVDAVGNILFIPAQRIALWRRNRDGYNEVVIDGIGTLAIRNDLEEIENKYNKWMNEHIRFMISLKRDGDNDNLINKFKS